MPARLCGGGRLAVLSVAAGFDNVVSITLIQRWAPPAMLGRVWGLLTLYGLSQREFRDFGAGDGESSRQGRRGG